MKKLLFYVLPQNFYFKSNTKAYQFERLFLVEVQEQIQQEKYNHLFDYQFVNYLFLHEFEMYNQNIANQAKILYYKFFEYFFWKVLL